MRAFYAHYFKSLMAPKNRKSNPERPGRDAAKTIAGVRIIGGRLRGRRINYSGDARTRPMKGRLREAIFNLIGPSIRGKHALDLFAGTGALALEAISRGADRATLIEQHFPTATLIRRNVAELGLEAQAEVVSANTFIWRIKGSEVFISDESPFRTAWVVFCSPPYDFYVERTAEMLELIEGLIRSAPAESIFVVEADARFDFRLLPDPNDWDVRAYPPAVVGIFRKPPA